MTSMLPALVDMFVFMRPDAVPHGDMLSGNLTSIPEVHNNFTRLSEGMQGRCPAFLLLFLVRVKKVRIRVEPDLISRYTRKCYSFAKNDEDLDGVRAWTGLFLGSDGLVALHQSIHDRLRRPLWIDGKV